MYGQGSFLVANFALFLILVKGVDAASFGTWALYITIISIADSLRQGLLQNGLTRALIQRPTHSARLISTGFWMNYGFILIIALILWFPSLMVVDDGQGVSLTALLAHAGKTLTGLGTIQFLNILYFSRQDFKQYFISNLIYLLSFAAGLLILVMSDQLDFVAVINLQLIASISPALYYLIRNPVRFAMPSGQSALSLLSFGKYIAATNLLSMLFHKTDVLMLAVFTDPVSVAMFHFATKIVGYAELPLNALSQVIYPRLAASYHSHGVSRLKDVYISSIVNLLQLAIPVIAGVIMFRNTIISILSTNTYQAVSPLILILCISALVKPLGRVFGLTLDAMGKPKTNFQMLCLSLMTNIVMNLIFIPLWGVSGAAIATACSILITVVWGQYRIKKHIDIDHKDIIKALLPFSLKTRTLKTKTL
jgi:O-antigen/teichoic acid export membrane protein